MSERKMNALRNAQEVFALYMQGKVSLAEMTEAYNEYVYA